ncbi:MAG: DUF3237 domain-containing protein [Janthinobacterium lividum]
MPEILTRHLFTLRAQAGETQQVGETPLGKRIIVPIVSGSFEGERLRGTLEPGGADWMTLRRDGVTALDVRLVLRTDDGAQIMLTYHGLRHGPPEVMARLAQGELVEASEYYLRTTLYFETSAEKYLWLNRLVAVATGQRPPTGPIYDVFEVL